jgi:hypothetical protein
MLKEINAHAGAVNVGSETFHAAVYAGPMKVFGTFTRDLQAVLGFFKDNGVTTVAMEATGVYWMPLYQTMVQGGLKVCVVNGAHVKNVTGRKTDVADCQWLAEFLHVFSGIRPACSAGFQTCRAADFQIGRWWNVTVGAGLEARGTADLEVCATRHEAGLPQWRRYPLESSRNQSFLSCVSNGW